MLLKVHVTLGFKDFIRGPSQRGVGGMGGMGAGLQQAQVRKVGREACRSTPRPSGRGPGLRQAQLASQPRAWPQCGCAVMSVMIS